MPSLPNVQVSVVNRSPLRRIDGHRERAVLEPARRRRDDPFNRAGGRIELDNLGTEEAVVRDRQPGIQRTVLPERQTTEQT